MLSITITAPHQDKIFFYKILRQLGADELFALYQGPNFID